MIEVILLFLLALMIYSTWKHVITQAGKDVEHNSKTDRRRNKRGDQQTRDRWRGDRRNKHNNK
jgi:hypothetical protein